MPSEISFPIHNGRAITDPKQARDLAAQLEAQAALIAGEMPQEALKLRQQAYNLRGQDSSAERVGQIFKNRETVSDIGSSIAGAAQSGYNWLFGGDQAAAAKPQMTPEQMSALLQDPNSRGGDISQELIKALYPSRAQTFSMQGAPMPKMQLPGAGKLPYADYGAARQAFQGSRPGQVETVPYMQTNEADALMQQAAPTDLAPIDPQAAMWQGMAQMFQPNARTGDMLLGLGLGMMMGKKSGEQMAADRKTQSEDRKAQYSKEMAGYSLDKGKGKQSVDIANINARAANQHDIMDYQRALAGLEAEITKGRQAVDISNIERGDANARTNLELMLKQYEMLAPRIAGGMIAQTDASGKTTVTQPAKQPDATDLLKIMEMSNKNVALPPLTQLMSDPAIAPYVGTALGLKPGADPQEYMMNLQMMQAGGKDLTTSVLMGKMLNDVRQMAAQGDMGAQLALQRLTAMMQRNTLTGTK